LLKCPLCSARTEVEGRNTNNLPTNVIWQKVSEQAGEYLSSDGTYVLCSICATDTYQSDMLCCFDCNVDMCSKCGAKHRSNVIFSGHNVENKLNLRCTTHKLYVSYFCMECSVFLCLACIHNDKCADHHKQRKTLRDLRVHLTEDIKSAELRINNDVDCNDNDRYTHIDAAIVRVDEMKESVEVHTKNIMREVKDRRRVLVTQLDIARQHLEQRRVSCAENISTKNSVNQFAQEAIGRTLQEMVAASCLLKECFDDIIELSTDEDLPIVFNPLNSLHVGTVVFKSEADVSDGNTNNHAMSNSTPTPVILNSKPTILSASTATTPSPTFNVQERKASPGQNYLPTPPEGWSGSRPQPTSQPTPHTLTPIKALNKANLQSPSPNKPISTPNKPLAPISMPNKPATPISTPNKTATQNGTPNKVASPNGTPNRVSTQNATPIQAATQNTTPNKEATHNGAPNKVATPIGTPNKVVSQNGTPNKVATPNATPNKVATQHTTPNKVATQNATRKNSPVYKFTQNSYSSTSDKVAAQKAMPNKVSVATQNASPNKSGTQCTCAPKKMEVAQTGTSSKATEDALYLLNKSDAIDSEAGYLISKKRPVQTSVVNDAANAVELTETVAVAPLLLGQIVAPENSIWSMDAHDDTAVMTDTTSRKNLVSDNIDWTCPPEPAWELPFTFNAASMVVLPSEDVVVTSTKGMIMLFGPDGLEKWFSTETKKRYKGLPLMVTYDSHHREVIMSCIKAGKIVVSFLDTSNLNILRQIQLKTRFSDDKVAIGGVLTDDRIVVATNRAISIYSKNHVIQNEITEFSYPPKDTECESCQFGMAILPNNVIVTCYYNARHVSMIDTNGSCLAQVERRCYNVTLNEDYQLLMIDDEFDVYIVSGKLPDFIKVQQVLSFPNEKSNIEGVAIHGTRLYVLRSMFLSAYDLVDKRGDITKELENSTTAAISLGSKNKKKKNKKK